MRLVDIYTAACERAEIVNDDNQRRVIEQLQRVIDDLMQTKQQRWLKVFSWISGHTKPIKGLYLYGPVGVGKTYLMDLLYDQVNSIHKSRFHFHHFMQYVDAQLRQLQGHINPVQAIATQFAQQTQLLCLDEFLVHDVAHAMILAELLQTLFARGVVIVATANTRPDDLYLDGIHRERFLPAIALLKEHCETILLNEEKDYRQGRLSLVNSYLYPLNDMNQQLMATQFSQLAANPLPEITIPFGFQVATRRGEDERAACTDPYMSTRIEPQQRCNLKSEEYIMIQNRLITVVKYSQDVVWFEFDNICNLPRCQLDYLEIADRFDIILLSNLPQLGQDDTTQVLLLIHLIDVLYDRGIRLIVSAAVPVEHLYPAGPLHAMFQRTLSRLEEMKSADYWQRCARTKLMSKDDV